MSVDPHDFPHTSTHVEMSFDNSGASLDDVSGQMAESTVSHLSVVDVSDDSSDRSLHQSGVVGDRSRVTGSLDQVVEVSDRLVHVLAALHNVVYSLGVLGLEDD